MYTQNMTKLPDAFPGNGYKFSKAANNGTLISIILDESGSMSSARDATISGFNEFVEGQKATKDVGQAYLTVTKLNAPRIITLYKNKPIDQVEPLTYETYRPEGWTNLNDAIGTALMSIEETLSAVEESERPGVIVVIMTDGQENASKTYSTKQIKSMVAAAEAADFTFLFLGANIDAFAVGSDYGMTTQNTRSYSTDQMNQTMSSVSASASAMRSAKHAGWNTQTIYASGAVTAGFTDVETKIDHSVNRTRAAKAEVKDA